LLQIMAWANNWWIDRKEGQTMAEYGLILAAIAVVVMVAALALGTAITNKFNVVKNSL
jgi:Flp pilus assembly pilin Flp